MPAWLDGDGVVQAQPTHQQQQTQSATQSAKEQHQAQNPTRKLLYHKASHKVSYQPTSMEWTDTQTTEEDEQSVEEG